VRGYYYSQRGFSLFKTDVNYEDKNMLVLAASVFSLFKGTPLQDKFSQLVDKVLSSSNLDGKVHGLSEMQIIEIGSNLSVKGSEHIPRLLDAIFEKDCLEMVYQGIGKPEKKKHVCPYIIKKYLNRWFMVAYDHNGERAQKTSVFALDGIRSLDLSNKKYIIDPEFIPEDYFKYSLGVWHWHDQQPVKVELIFTGYIDQIIYSPLHHSQTYQLSDNRETLHVQIEVYQSPELEMLIQSFGDKVKVVSPQSLVDTMKTRAQKTLDIYS
jgi:predicted DNA-binding transcriptional regulator YafY